jgi:two-component system sensor histidine kinase QseC
MMRSLRRTLIWRTALGSAAVLVTAGVLLYVLVRASLLAQFDRALLENARILASAVEREDEGLDLAFDDLDMREFQGDRPTAYLQLWLADGATLYRSSRASASELSKPTERSASPRFVRATLPDGRNGRSVTFTFVPRTEHERARDAKAEDGAQPNPRSGRTSEAIDLVLARDTSPIDRALGRLGVLLLFVGLAAVATSTAILWRIVGRSIQPVEQLAREIGQVDEDDLAKRIELDAVPLEIQPVVDRLNDLLCRLEAAFRRERAFSANVAHELRNPLAGLRLKMDVATSRTRQPEEYEKAINECRRITAQVQTMVENLLSLARLEAGQVQVHREPLLLGRLVRELWEPLNAEARSRMLNVQWSLEGEMPIVSDPSLVSVVVRNVLENAVAYADEGGIVRIDARSTDGKAEISVANSGSRLSQEQVERAFEQFWRGDEARTDVGVHCGLGLSLVRKIASVLGGTAVARSSVGADFEVSVSIPTRTGDSEALGNDPEDSVAPTGPGWDD